LVVVAVEAEVAEAEVNLLEVASAMAPVWVNLPEAVCGSGPAKASSLGSLRAMGSAMGSDVPLRQAVLTSGSLVSA